MKDTPSLQSLEPVSSSAVESTNPAPMDGLSRRGYSAYVVFILTFAYTLNFIDRSLVSVLQEPIRFEFRLSDFELGLLGGPAFALLYGVLGLPIARLAERHNRISVLSCCLALWSLMTGICGLVGNYGQLLVARVGVSIGESGCSPAANSIIADYFEPNRRATALSIYTAGSSMGGVLAALIGGWVAHVWGWRNAFLALGLPGVAVALAAKTTVREPRRSGETFTPPFIEVLHQLWSKSTFRHTLVGACIGWFVAFGIGQYSTSFLMRAHGLTLIEATRFTGAVESTAGFIGITLAGVLADRFGKRFPRAIMTIPVIGLLIAAPSAVIAYLAPSFLVAAIAIPVMALTLNLFTAPLWVITLHMVGPRMRATAIALVSLIVTIAGYGLGPPAVGWLSDHISALVLTVMHVAASSCALGQTYNASWRCSYASATGLRDAMALTGLLYLWAALHFYLGSRTFLRDRLP